MTDLERAIAGAIEKIREVDAEFADVCLVMYARRFTGMTPLHWRNGIPAAIQIGSTKVWLARRSKHDGVDKSTAVVDAVTV